MGKIVAGIVILAVVGLFVFMRNNAAPSTMAPTTSKIMAPTELTGPLKEFTMTAYYDDQGKWFSLKEITVKKGDHVRIKVTNTKGMHDLTLDEFGIKKELPLNQEVDVEFTASKVGTFEYYCSKPGHRAGGQFGKLIVEN